MRHGAGLAWVEYQAALQPPGFDSTGSILKPLTVINSLSVASYGMDTCQIISCDVWLSSHACATLGSSVASLTSCQKTKHYLWVDQQSGLRCSGNKTKPCS